ncbi:MULTISPECIES: putative phage tail protein [Brevibacillus]|uniref:putative phage tail protein n=1 Tax=Brevibacillus TaxID=55080 RepID=UPI0004F359E1|nr:putative phage tail protein [Brevibacillus borstelensis]KKX52557.1 hypothetical protein X546_24415 [Brevibacillus borstelensis cifa_chp40]
MGFKDFLFNHFPHRWLDPNKPGTARIFNGLGNILDYAFSLVEKVSAESRIRTSVDSLSDREMESGLPVSPALDIETRRNRILAKKREVGGPVNTEDFTAALSLLSGYAVEIIPDHNRYFVTYKFSGRVERWNLDLGSVESYIQSNKLAHLGYAYDLEFDSGSVVYQSPWNDSLITTGAYQACNTFSAGGEYEL